MRGAGGVGVVGFLGWVWERPRRAGARRGRGVWQADAVVASRRVARRGSEPPARGVVFREGGVWRPGDTCYRICL